MANKIGYALWIKVEWKKCEIESCLRYFKRKNWVSHSEWKKYVPDNPFGDMEGFTATELSKQLGPYARRAKKEVPH